MDAETGLEANRTGLESNGSGPEPNGTGPEPNGTGPGSSAEAGAPEAGQAVRAPVPRPALGALADDPRLPLWIGRAVLAAAAGIAVMVWQGWRLGVTAAALVAIADTIFRSKMAAVQVTTAQRRTRRRLFLLRPAGYVALHRRAIPGTDWVIDHLVIGPAGVFAIDSEDWDKRMPVRTSSHKNLWHGPRNMKDRLEHAHWEADRAAELLSAALGSPVSVRAVLAVYGPKIMWDVAEIRDVDTFSGPRLRKYLRRRAKRRDAKPLRPGEIERIEKAAHVAFPQAPTS